MLEQAVYAGRNHTLSLAVALALAACAPAQASDVARVALGSEIAALVAGPDGGAWVGIDPRGLRAPQIGRADPDGRFHIVPGAGIAVFGATLGPDGRAWFDTGENLLRVDAAGTVAPMPAPPDGDQALATGPDGTLWRIAREQLARIAPDGTTTLTPLALGACEHRSTLHLVRAADDAMWFDTTCGLIRLGRDGAVTKVELDVRLSELAADAAGGVWYASWDAGEGPTAGHVDAAGHVSPVNTRRVWQSVAVAPDGAAWFAGARCRLLRVTPAGERSLVRAPIPAGLIRFDPAGGQWLASPQRLVHDEPPRGCDDTPPSIGISPGRTNRQGYGRISLATLRKAGGFKLRLREPVAVEGYLSFAGDDEPFASLYTVTRRARTLRIGLGPHRLRALARRHRPELDLIVRAQDREGNGNEQEIVLAVTP